MTPKRSTSYRGSEVAAISIAQHMMPNTNGQVELRFAQLKNSPTKPAFSLSRTAPPGPRFIGASMFCSTHWTKSLRPQADDVRLLRTLDHPIRTPSYGPQIALRQAGPRHRCHGHRKGLWSPPQTISRIQMTYTQLTQH